MINLDIAPKPKDISLVRNKIIISLIGFLALFACFKTYQNAGYVEKMVTMQTEMILSQYKDYDDKDKMDKIFTTGRFCGWQISSRGDQDKISSKDYDARPEDSELYTQKIEKDDQPALLYICTNETSKIKNGAFRQIAGILFVAAVLILLINNENPNKQNQNANKTKIPDPSEG